MTCIIGLAVDGKVFIGADSAASDGYTSRAMSNEKLFRKGDFIIGSAGSIRMSQLIRYHLSIPERVEGQTDEHFIHVSFLNALRDCLKINGLARIENNTENNDGEFILGYKGKVYTICGNLAVLSHGDGLEVTGIGQYVALGAMTALNYMSPTERITKALEIVHRFQPNGVLPPFTVMEG